MDLFTYLMARKGKKIYPHKSDLFSYLLATHKIPIKTETGTTIEITAKLTKLNELDLYKESTQNTTTGKNLLNPNGNSGALNDLTFTNNGDGSFTINGTASANTTFSLSSKTITLEANQKYTQTLEVLSGDLGNASIVPAFKNSGGTITYNYFNCNKNNVADSKTPTDTMTSHTYNIYIASGVATTNCRFRVQLEKGDSTNYEPYTGGIPAPNPEFPEPINVIKNNLTIEITDGENTKTATIDLGDNEVAGIGNYKDIVKVDCSGNVTLTKNIGKVVLDGSENWNKFNNFLYYNNMSFELSPENSYTIPNLLSDKFTIVSFNDLSLNPKIYMSANQLGDRNNQRGVSLYVCDNYDSVATLKTWLSTHNTEVYYVLAEAEEPISLGTIDLSLFKGTNIITNSSEADMIIKYY